MPFLFLIRKVNQQAVITLQEQSPGVPGFAALLVAMVLIAAAGGVWWQQHETRRAALTTPVTTNQQQAETASRIAVLTNGNGHSDGVPEAANVDVKSTAGTETPVDLTETSFQNPFRSGYWTSRGWKFDTKAMHSIARTTGEATFRRSYKKLMIEMRILPETNGPLGFSIRLLAPETKSEMTIAIRKDTVIVSERLPSGKQREISRKKRNLKIDRDHPGLLKLVATGNRVSVAWNGRRVLTCNQPVGQSGKAVNFSLVTHAGALRISELRIEGD